MMARCGLLKIMIFCIMIIFSGCQSRDSIGDGKVNVSQSIGESRSNVETDENKEESDSRITAKLIGTPISWDFPAGYTCTQTDDGFLAYNDDQVIGVYCRRQSLKALSNWGEDRVADDVLRSRLFDLVDTEYYTVSNSVLQKVKLAEQEGFILTCDYSVEGESGRLVALCIQYNNDLIYSVCTGPAEYSEVMWDLMNTITVSSGIHTIWDI